MRENLISYNGGITAVTHPSRYKEYIWGLACYNNGTGKQYFLIWWISGCLFLLHVWLVTGLTSWLLSSSLLAAMVGGLAASSAMLSPVVQTVLQMGFETSLVESLVQTKYLLTGQQYTSVSDLVSDVLQAEQEEGQRGPQSRGNSQCGV